MREYTPKREKCRYFTTLAKLKIMKNKTTQQTGTTQNVETKKKAKKQLTNDKNENNVVKVHLSEQQYNEKIKNLEARISETEGPEHRSKRKRLYHELAQLKKNVVLIDPSQTKVKIAEDKKRRIRKKIDKKVQIIKDIRLEKQKQKYKVCLICKQMGHVATSCRENTATKLVVAETICYNCGSKEHRLKDCRKPKSQNLKFATCFVCKEEGHISRDCPSNPNGLYANGGGCFICNSTKHIQKDCPSNPSNRIRKQKQEEDVQEYFVDEQF